MIKFNKNVVRVISFAMALFMVLTTVAMMFTGCGIKNEAKDRVTAEVTEYLANANEVPFETGAEADTLVTEVETETEDQVAETDYVDQNNHQVTLFSVDDLKAIATSDDADIDLTIVDQDTAYSACYSIMMSPDQYVGQTIKVRGFVALYTDQTTGTVYSSIIVNDSDGDAVQGIEFALEDGSTPESGVLATIAGTLETYEDGGLVYLHAANATIIY